MFYLSPSINQGTQLCCFLPLLCLLSSTATKTVSWTSFDVSSQSPVSRDWSLPPVYFYEKNETFDIQIRCPWIAYIFIIGTNHRFGWTGYLGKYYTVYLFSLIILRSLLISRGPFFSLSQRVFVRSLPEWYFFWHCILVSLGKKSQVVLFTVCHIRAHNPNWWPIPRW